MRCRLHWGGSGLLGGLVHLRFVHGCLGLHVLLGNIVAVGACRLILEIHIATVWAFDDVARYLHATAWAHRCLVTDLVSTFWTFYDCHVVE